VAARGWDILDWDPIRVQPERLGLLLFYLGSDCCSIDRQLLAPICCVSWMSL